MSTYVLRNVVHALGRPLRTATSPTQPVGLVRRRLLKAAAVFSGAALVTGTFGFLGSSAGAAPGPTIPPPVSGATVAGVCGNTGLLAGPITAPAGAVTVLAGSSIQAAVNANPAGTTFYLPSARYDLSGPVTPKTGDTLLGGPATVIDGGNVATAAFKAGVAFQTPWTMADNVTLKSLIVQHFNAHDDQVVVNEDAGDGWVLDRMTVADNHGGAVMMGSRNSIINSCLTRNGQYGFNTYRCRGYASGCATSTTVTDLLIDRTEISYNDTEMLAITRPGCGCSGGGKFWDVRGARITSNWVHHNNSVGLWADTNDADFLFQGNVIEDNDAAGIMYEISYNARIIGNTLRRNAIGQGTRRLARGVGDYFPDGAIYISESGGDAAATAAARARGESWTQVNADQNTLEIADNSFEDNWNGVVLWESADRYCSSSANTSSNYCTLYYPSFDSDGENMVACQGTLTGAALTQCRWKTKNVNVHNNLFAINRGTVANGCTDADNHCGRNAIFSQWGVFAAYPAEITQRAILFGQSNTFNANSYQGTWRFSAFDQAQSSIRSFATWTTAAPANAQVSYNLWTTPVQGMGQDANSVLAGVTPPPSSSSSSSSTTPSSSSTTPSSASTTSSSSTTVQASSSTAPASSSTTQVVTCAPLPTMTIATTAPATTAPPTTKPATTTTTSPTATRYEAERATWQSLSMVNWGSGWSGTGWLTSWDKPGYVDWTVTVPTAGTYSVGVRYLAPFLAANLDLTVNGTATTKMAFPKTAVVNGDWTSWTPAQTASQQVTLTAGVNHIRLVRSATANAGVSLDYLVVSRV